MKYSAGVIFYLTQFYKRNEIAFRLSIFYGMVTIAGENFHTQNNATTQLTTISFLER